MENKYPHTIDNGYGESITFTRLVKDPDGDWLEVENSVSPQAGPPMHVHHRQAEALTVVEGNIGVQTLDGEISYFGPGETVAFKAGVAHKFWNAGEGQLICKGWIKPAYNAEYFLTELYKSAANNGGRPGMFEAAWLMHRYRTEFDMLEMPGFVKKVILPVVLFFGKIMGKHRKFAGAPEPLSPST